jgi:diamine N-acetyltransferase
MSSFNANHGALISLQEITSGNLKAVLALNVSPEQKLVYPRSNAYSIAEAHYPPDDDPVWMRAICADDIPVGFIMTSEAPDRGEYFLWRLMVGEEFQRKGYASRAVELLIERIALNNGKVLITDHLEADGNAGEFYARHGFRYTGETLDGPARVMARVMRRDFHVGGQGDTPGVGQS